MARENSTMARISIAMFLCPADGGARSERVRSNSGLNYPTCVGRGFVEHGFDGSFSNKGATFGLHDISDGTAQTVALSEWVRGPGSVQLASQSPKGTIFNTVPQPDPRSFARDCAAGQFATSSVGAANKGHTWIMGEMGFSNYNHVLGPNDPSCYNDNSVPEGAYSASSMHNSGVNVLLLDSHVRFVSDRVETEIWKSIASRDGRETVSGDF